MSEASALFHFWWEVGAGMEAPPPVNRGFDILWPGVGSGIGIFWPQLFETVDWPGI